MAANNRYLLASQKAELAVKADSDGRMSEAMRYYEEASQQLVEYCKEDQSKYTQMSPHIHRYIERASEIQRELLKQENRSAASESHGSQVDANAQKQLEDMGLTSAQARDALIRFDNDVERSITWFLENPVEEDESPSQPTQRPTSLPPASTVTISNPPQPPPLPKRPAPPPPTPFQPPAPPPYNENNVRAPTLPTLKPTSSTQAPLQTMRQTATTPSAPATAITATDSKESDALIGVLRAAMVSTKGRCRCVMFTMERGDICGMPVALVGDPESETEIAGDLCWSCKYMEAISGIDATLANSDDEEDAEERKQQLAAQATQAAVQAQAKAEAQAPPINKPPSAAPVNSAPPSVVLSVPPPPVVEEPRGWFSGWLSGGKSVKEKEISNGALTRKDREALEGEFSALKGLKEHGVMSDTQKARFKLVRRSLRTNEALVSPLGIEEVTKGMASPRRGGTSHSNAAGGGGGSAPISQNHNQVLNQVANLTESESESQKVARLKKCLRDAKVSETYTCTCSLYTLNPGEVCGRPVALAVDPETNIATPTRMCWQCKRIEAYSL